LRKGEKEPAGAGTGGRPPPGHAHPAGHATVLLTEPAGQKMPGALQLRQSAAVWPAGSERYVPAAHCVQKVFA
jgi:hypothetical protein